MRRLQSPPRHASALVGVLAATLAVAAGCAPTIAPFSERAYEQAVSLKVEALSLMGDASEPFEAHRAEVEALRLDLAKAYEFAHGRPKNDLSAQQWAVLADPERNLLGGFLARWESAGSLSPVFTAEAQRLVADAFDTIIGLESGKLRPADVE
jgi:hypothetical protein